MNRGDVAQTNQPQRANMPVNRTSKMELIYNLNGAKFQKSTVEESQNQDAGNESGGQRMMRFGGADREVFFNFADKKVTESFEMENEPFLVEYKLGAKSVGFIKYDDIKKIAGFEAHKAVMSEDNGTQITIWYTTELPLIASPVPSLWTEGVVLQVESPRMNFVATGIEYIKVKDSEFTLPKKAKLLTPQELKVKQDEMRTKMREQFRNNGSRN